MIFQRKYPQILLFVFAILFSPATFANEEISFAPYKAVKNTYQEIDLSQLSIASVYLRGFSYTYSPVGLIARGIFDEFNATVCLIEKISRLNKLAQEFNLKKEIFLAPYLGPDGLKLLLYYMRAPQLLEGKKYQILDTNHRISSKITPFILRTLLHRFIKQFQNKNLIIKKDSFELKKAEGEEYRENLDHFIRQMGLIIFHTPDEKANFLYRELYNQGILTQSGQLKAKRHFKKITGQIISEQLKNIGISSPKDQQPILHDLGYLSPLDIPKIVEQFYSEIQNLSLIKQDLVDSLQKNRDVVEKGLNKLINDFHSDQNMVKNKLDLIILKSLTSAYKKEASSRATLDDKVLSAKISYLRELKGFDYHLFSLEKDLEQISFLLLKAFDQQNISNKNFQIVSLKEEDKVLAGAFYIRGLGFMSMGVSKIIPLFFSSLLTISQLTNLLLFGNSVTVFTRCCTLVIRGIHLYHAVDNLLDSVVSKKTLDKFDSYIKDLSKESSFSKDSSLYPLLLVTQFKIKSQQFIYKQKKKLFIHQIGMDSLWISYNILSILVCTACFFLILFVISSAAASYLTMGITFIGVLTAIPFIWLVLRDVHLSKNLRLYQEIVKVYNEGFKLENDQSLTERNRYLLDLFLDQTKEYFKIGKEYIKFQNNLKALKESSSPNDMSLIMSQIFSNRKNAYDLTKNFLKKKNDRNILFEQILDKNHISSTDRSLWLERLKPSYHITGIDYIFDLFNPTITAPVDKSTLLPQSSDEYWQDTALATLFSHLYTIYHKVQKNYEEYQLALKKENLTMNYFQLSLPPVDINHLRKKLKNRHDDLLEDRATFSFRDDLVRLNELHPKESILFAPYWSPQLIREIDQLILFDQSLVREAHAHLPLQKFPETPALSKLFKLYFGDRP